MPTKKQKIFAIFRYIKECQPYIYYNLRGAKECFRLSKWLVEEFGLPKCDGKDYEKIVKLSYNYINRELYTSYGNLERRYIEHGPSKIFRH